MKNNKKGFTLIELLAVIVILAIIMVIAVPRILDVINSSRSSAWNDSIKMIAKSIDLNTSLINPQTNSQTYTVSGLCTPSSGTVKEAIGAIADVGDIDTISCSSNTFTVAGKGQFAGKTGTIACTATGCQATDTTSSN